VVQQQDVPRAPQSRSSPWGPRASVSGQRDKINAPSRSVNRRSGGFSVHA
jgi:hypothetical protein